MYRSAPMICDSNISYNKRFICERSVIAGNEISKKNCKFTAKKKNAEETIVMRVGENEFIVSTMGEEVYFHCEKIKPTRGNYKKVFTRCK